MKKILLLILLLLPVTAYAVGTAFLGTMGGGPALVASGSCLWNNLYLSAANGVAHIDFNSANVLTDYTDGTYYLKIFDASLREISGYIKAAGSGAIGADVGADLLSGWDLTNWTPVNADCVIDNATTFHTTVNARGPYKNLLTQFALYKATLTHTSVGGSSITIMTFGPGNGISWGSVTSGVPTTHYGISEQTGGNYYIRLNTIDSTTIAAQTLNQVIGPSATGVTIVDTLGGTTYNWTVRTASFSYINGNITYEIWSGM